MISNAVSVVKTGSIIAFTGVSANVAMPTDSGGGVPKYIRIAATAPCYVKIGPSGVAAVVGDLLVQPADCVVLKVSNQTFVAVIQVTGVGTAQISPLEDA